MKLKNKRFHREIINGPLAAHSLAHWRPTRWPTSGPLIVHSPTPHSVLVHSPSFSPAPRCPPPVECCYFERCIVDHAPKVSPRSVMPWSSRHGHRAMVVAVHHGALVVVVCRGAVVRCGMRPCLLIPLCSFVPADVAVVVVAVVEVGSKKQKGPVWLFGRFKVNNSGNPWSTAKLGEVVAACTTGQWSPSWNIYKYLKKWEKFSDILRQNML
jgi:hypothetical protein